MEVNLCSYKDLPEERRDWQSNNGCGKEDATYLVVKNKGEIIRIESDAMEPEDATFIRDLKWIMSALLQAYELGKGEK